jgi:hypothetical protein
MMKPTSITEGHRHLENELQPSVITGTAQHHLGNKTYGIMAESWQQYPALLFLFFIFFFIQQQLSWHRTEENLLVVNHISDT